MSETVRNLTAVGKPKGLTLHGITFAHIVAVQNVADRERKAVENAERHGGSRSREHYERLVEVRDALMDAITGGDLRRYGFTPDHTGALKDGRRRELRAIGNAWRSGRKRSPDTYTCLLSIQDALNEVAAIVAFASPVEVR